MSTDGDDIVTKSAVIELLCAILERIRSVPSTPCKPASKGAKRYSNRISDDDSDDDSSLTIDESRTNRNVNEISEMAAKLFNIPKSDLKTKMQEHTTS